MSDQPPGLYRKFDVHRVDGRDQDGGDRHGARYLVLDLTFDIHAKPAVLTYAAEVRRTLPQLAADLRDLYGLEPAAEKLATLSDVFVAGEDDTERGGCAICGEEIELRQPVLYVPAGYGPPNSVVLAHLWCAVKEGEIDLGLEFP